MRLDSLTQQELNKLYKRSCVLTQIGFLQFASLIIFFGAAIICFFIQEWVVAILYLTAIFPAFAMAYVFKYVRTNAARKFFYFSSIVGIITPPVIVLLHPEKFGFIQTLIYMLWVLINYEILKSAGTAALFGAEGFSHRQIALARKKKKRNEAFSDEELPKSTPRPKLERVCTITAFVFVILLTLAAIGNALNPVESVESLRLKADSGDAEAQLKYAGCLFEGKVIAKDEKKGAEYLLKSAQNGNSQAQIQAAALYIQGIGVEKNLQEGEKWLLAAAEKNNQQAYLALSTFYAGGYDTAVINADKAFLWSKRAADTGLAAGKTNLAICYLQGLGCARNREEAVKLLKEAAAQGDPTAQEILKSDEAGK